MLKAEKPVERGGHIYSCLLSRLCHGKCEVAHPPSSFHGLIYTTVSEESAFWLANNKLLTNKPGQHRPYWAIDL